MTCALFILYYIIMFTKKINTMIFIHICSGTTTIIWNSDLCFRTATLEKNGYGHNFVGDNLKHDLSSIFENFIRNVDKIAPAASTKKWNQSIT